MMKRLSCLLTGLLLAGVLIPGLLPAQFRQQTRSFPLTQVQLLEGPFRHALDRNQFYLLQFEPDRLLARFRTEAGLSPKAPPYKGWEGESLAGHSLGHHLSGCAMMYQSSGDPRFLDRVNYIVAQLSECQAAKGSGYIGAMPRGDKIMEEEIARGQIRAQSFDLNGIWSPFYTHHKVLAGLRDAYRLCGNDQALQVGKAFADWINTIVGHLPEEVMQQVLACEFGGIQETLADLYADSGEEKYLRLARLFHHRAVVDSLARGKDVLPGKHANTQIPKLVGTARLFEMAGRESDRDAALFFWHTVVDHHSYATGGNGNHEYFGAPDRLRNRLSDETTETCNVYNMLKLSGHLFAWKPSVKVADFSERILFNHLLASQHPETGRVIYNLSLEMGGKKTYQDPEWFTCCVGSGMETHSKYGESIYFHSDEGLYVNQFIASRLNWKEKGLVLTQQTGFPEEQGTHLSFQTRKPLRLTLYLRYPAWAQDGVEIRINGKKQKIKAGPGDFIALHRNWKDGDKLSMDMPFRLRLEAMPDDSNRVAVCYGPLVLAGDLGEVDDPRIAQADFVPVLMPAQRAPETWLQAVAGRANTFESRSAGRPREISFQPFHRTHDRRYSVFFDLYSEKSWAEHQQAIEAEQARRRRLEKLTFDAIQPGDSISEAAHAFAGERVSILPDFKGRKAREADRGGWMSFQLKIDPTIPMALVIDYWGGFTGSKTFDILVEGEKIATENISGIKDGEFLDIRYELPGHLLRGKDRITVRFAPHTGHRGGPFFYARTIRKDW